MVIEGGLHTQTDAVQQVSSRTGESVRAMLCQIDEIFVVKTLRNSLHFSEVDQGKCLGWDQLRYLAI